LICGSRFRRGVALTTVFSPASSILINSSQPLTCSLCKCHSGLTPVPRPDRRFDAEKLRAPNRDTWRSDLKIPPGAPENAVFDPRPRAFGALIGALTGRGPKRGPAPNLCRRKYVGWASAHAVPTDQRRRKKRRGGSGNRPSWPQLPCVPLFVGRPPTVST